MSIIFSSDDDYETQREAFLSDGPIGISSSMKESVFNEWWDREHGISRSVAPTKSNEPSK